MRWNILWLVTVLAATSFIEGASININNFLRLHVQPTPPVPKADLNVSINNVKIKVDTSKENLEHDHLETKVKLDNNFTNNNQNGIYQDDSSGYSNHNLTIESNTIGCSYVNTSSSSVLTKTHDETVLEKQRNNEDGENISRNHQQELEVDDATIRRSQREIAVDKPTKTIETEYGKVAGFAWEGSDDIIAYFDIPYGKFTSYFQEPEKPDEWELHTARNHIKQCPQMHKDAMVGDTDCLTLSIFTPREAKDASVLFYIHESFLNIGSGDPDLYGPDYLVKRGIILVLPNYRIGALGFLCLQNSTAPGNAALKDLTLALEWIKNNIKSFGGNSSNIIVSGDGTAGALAGYLSLSDQSKERINKVISESGAVLSHWAIDRTPISTATEVVEQIRNLTRKYEDDVFAEITLEELVRTTHIFSLKPCIEENDNGTITKNPWTMLSNEEVKISFMIGSANHAALQTALQYDDTAISQLNDDFESVLPNDLVFPNINTRNNVAQRIKEQYFGSEDIILSSATKNLSQYHTDVSYLGPDLRLARHLVAAGAIVYLYEFSFVGKLNSELESIDSESHHGAIRGDLVGYLFSKKGRILEESSKEYKVMDIVTDLWVSFIKDRQPSAEGVTWNEFHKTDDTQEQWLSIGEEVSLQSGFHYDRLRIWTEVYQNYFIDTSATVKLKADGYIFYGMAIYLIKISKYVFM